MARAEQPEARVASRLPASRGHALRPVQVGPGGPPRSIRRSAVAEKTRNP